VTRPDGKCLNAALWPDSAYERAIRRLKYEALHQFGPSRQCYLWSAEPCSVKISVDGSRTWLCLAQVNYADHEAGRAAAHAFPLSHEGAGDAPGLRYRVEQGPVVIACSPNDARDTSTAIDALPLSMHSPGAMIDFSFGSHAFALWLMPGVYESSLFYHEEDRWAVSWCKLQRVSG
jgi:hypothetical protein